MEPKPYCGKLQVFLHWKPLFILLESWLIHLSHPRKHSESNSACLVTDRWQCDIHFSNCSAWPNTTKMRMDTKNHLTIALEAHNIQKGDTTNVFWVDTIFWWNFGHMCDFLCSPGQKFQSCHTFLSLDPQFCDWCKTLWNACVAVKTMTKWAPVCSKSLLWANFCIQWASLCFMEPSNWFHHSEPHFVWDNASVQMALATNHPAWPKNWQSMSKKCQWKSSDHLNLLVPDSRATASPEVSKTRDTWINILVPQNLMPT